MKTTFFAILLVLSASTILAGPEYVTLIKVLDNDDQGIIERRNGERWLIEKGIGAISFWRFEGKKILIHSPGIFCGIGSKVILPERGQEARIWKAEQIEDSPVESITGPTDTQITAAALSFLGYFNPKATNKGQNDLLLAMKAFQKDSGLEQSGKMSLESQIALSKTISKRKPVTEQSIRLRRLILDSAERLMNLDRQQINHAIQGTGDKIESQVDGDFEGWEGDTLVKLTNGQVWQQTEYHYDYHYAFMPEVIILKTAGGYKMIVDGVSKAVGVTRLK